MFVKRPRLLAGATLPVALGLVLAGSAVLVSPASSQPPDKIVTPIASASERWRAELNGTGGTFAFAQTIDAAEDVAILLDGSVVAAGRLRNEDDTGGGSYRSHYDFTVTRRDAATGAEIARFEADGGDFRGDEALTLAVDSQGNTIAAGVLRPDLNGSFNFEFAVIKLGSSMNPLWTPDFYLRDGSLAETGGSPRDIASAVAVDSNDDVFAAGTLVESGSGGDLALCKIDGSTGSELWCATLDGSETSENDFDLALDVVVDSNDDAIVVGSLEDSGGDVDFVVAKFAGAGDGLGGPQLIWSRQLDGSGTGVDIGFSLAVAPVQGAPDAVYATGFLHDALTDFDLAVARLDGATGVPTWTRQVDGSLASGMLPFEDEIGSHVSVDPSSGDLIVCGALETATNGRDAFVARLNEATGVSIWEGTATGTFPGAPDCAMECSLLPNGDVVMAGSFWNEHDNLSPPANNPNGDPDPSNADISVAAFDGSGDGFGGLLEKWRVDLLGFDNRFPQNIPPFHSLDLGSGMAVASDGDVFVVGRITRPNESLSSDHTNFLISRVGAGAPAVPIAAAYLPLAFLSLVGLARWRLREGERRTSSR